MICNLTNYILMDKHYEYFLNKLLKILKFIRILEISIKSKNIIILEYIKKPRKKYCMPHH